ncbi:MAG: hypothetical protein QM739_12160 [Propionivibrio sp.]
MRGIAFAVGGVEEFFIFPDRAPQPVGEVGVREFLDHFRVEIDPAAQAVADRHQLPVRRLGRQGVRTERAPETQQLVAGAGVLREPLQGAFVKPIFGLGFDQFVDLFSRGAIGLEDARPFVVAQGNEELLPGLVRYGHRRARLGRGEEIRGLLGNDEIDVAPGRHGAVARGRLFEELRHARVVGEDLEMHRVDLAVDASEFAEPLLARDAERAVLGDLAGEVLAVPALADQEIGIEPAEVHVQRIEDDRHAFAAFLSRTKPSSVQPPP